MSDVTQYPGKRAESGAFDLGQQIAVFLLVTAFYVITAPANQSIVIDGYIYARTLTDGSPLADAPQRELLWLLVMRGVLGLASAFVAEPDPFRISVYMNAAQTALAIVIMARILIRHFDLDRTSAFFTAAFFGTCYGIWRYATAVEVYATSALLAAANLYLLFEFDRSGAKRPLNKLIGLAAFGVFATYAYQPLGFLPALVAPLYIALRGRVKDLPIYLGAFVVLLVAGGQLSDLVSGSGQQASAAGSVASTLENLASMPTWKTPFLAIYALGSDILSANWLPAFQPLMDFLFRLMERIYDEEIYAATQAGWMVWVPFVTLPAFFVLLTLLVVNALRFRLRRPVGAKEAALTLWLILHSLMMLVLSAGGFEGWLLALVPLSMLVGLRLIRPGIAAGRHALVTGLFAVFVTHNWFAGIGILYPQSSDFFTARSGAVLNETGPDDLIVIGTNWGFDQYLKFRADAQLLRIDDSSVDEARRAIDSTLSHGGKVVIFDDVFDPPEILKKRRPDLIDELAALKRDFAPLATRFDSVKPGKAYLIAPPKVSQ